VADLAVEYVEVGSITLDPANARAHSPKNLETIKGSLRRFGQQKPIVVSGDGIVAAGNGTLLGARELGWTQIAIVRTTLSGAELAAYGIADNRSGELAEWDLDALAETLGGLQIDGVDLAEIGFDEADLADLLGDSWGGKADGEQVGDGDDPPDAEAIVDPVTKPGDVWRLGRHRLVCGDATEAEVVALAVDGALADMVWTDPPYGVEYVGKTKDALTIENDARDADGLRRLLDDSFRASAASCIDGAAVYVAHPPGALSVVFGQAFLAAGWRLHETLVWKKDSFVLGHSDYHYMHEPILYGYTPGGGRRGRGGEGWYGDHSQTTVLEFARPKRSEDHPTMKPVALVAHCIGNSAPKRGRVLDPFAGSGTTLIAAHDLGRGASLVELDPRYCDVICRRWQTFTDEMPVLESTGEPHDFGLYDATQAA
jgi:DNA modification methylase